MCFNQDGVISSLNGKLLKLVDKLIYLSSNISSTEIDVNIDKSWTAIDRLLTMWVSDLSAKIKLEFFPAVAVSVLLYGYILLWL